MDKVFIKQLSFDCIIGIYPRERVEPQPLLVDLEMACDITPAALNNDLEQSLNYAAISESIIRFCQNRQAELLETLAQELWHHLHDDFNVLGVKLTIHKPNAVPEARSVGVSIVRGQFN